MLFIIVLLLCCCFVVVVVVVAAAASGFGADANASAVLGLIAHATIANETPPTLGLSPRMKENRAHPRRTRLLAFCQRRLPACRFSRGGGSPLSRILRGVYLEENVMAEKRADEGLPTAHCHAALLQRQISVPTLLVFRSAQGGVCALLLFLFKCCKLICVLLCVMPSHILYRRPATAVPSSVPGSYGKPASGTARSLLVELVTEDAGGASGSRALVAVHRVAEHGSMGHSVECTWERGESESVDVWARGVFCRGESADRGHVHLCTKGHSGCHVGDHDLHCLEWRVVPRGEKHPTWVGFDEEGPHTKRQARRRKVPNELTALDGHEGPPLFPPINLLAVAAGELEESLLGPLPGGFDTRPRTECAEARTVSLIRPGLPVRSEEVTPRIGKRCPRSPSRRRSSSQRHDQRKSDCRLRRRLASVVKEYQGIREELECGQSARHKMLMTVAESTMQQVMLLEARKSKRSRKHNKKSTRKRRTASSSASWTGSGVTSDTESEDLGLEPSSGVM